MRTSGVLPIVSQNVVVAGHGRSSGGLAACRSVVAGIAPEWTGEASVGVDRGFFGPQRAASLEHREVSRLYARAMAGVCMGAGWNSGFWASSRSGAMAGRCRCRRRRRPARCWPTCACSRAASAANTSASCCGRSPTIRAARCAGACPSSGAWSTTRSAPGSSPTATRSASTRQASRSTCSELRALVGRRSRAACRPRTLEAAAARYRGNFLEGLEFSNFHDFHTWCVAEREQALRDRAALLTELIRRLADGARASPAACSRAGRPVPVRGGVPRDADPVAQRGAPAG